jgi:Fe-S cluster biogenesis protein NfuA/nitrite reductase/ring-hydroxylating ferredoxin subunit
VGELRTEPQQPPADLRATGERIEALVDASAAGGPVARERAEELVRLVSNLYGAGLERFMELLHESGRLDEALLADLAADDLLASLLLVHDLHPYDVQTRVELALDSVRPYLGSHGGDVELLTVHDDGTVRLRLLGSCDGCPSSSVTLKLAVEGAIEAAAPEVTMIEVEEASARAGGAAVISVESLTVRLHDASAQAGSSWQPLDDLPDLPPGQATTVQAAGTPLWVCRVADDLFAFRDRCAACGSSLAGAVPARRLGGAVGDAVLTCPVCHLHFDVRRAGACLDEADLHLEPLPLLTEGATASVAVPTAVVA